MSNELEPILLSDDAVSEPDPDDEPPPQLPLPLSQPQSWSHIQPPLIAQSQQPQLWSNDQTPILQPQLWPNPQFPRSRPQLSPSALPNFHRTASVNCPFSPSIYPPLPQYPYPYEACLQATSFPTQQHLSAGPSPQSGSKPVESRDKKVVKPPPKRSKRHNKPCAEVISLLSDDDDDDDDDETPRFEPLTSRKRRYTPYPERTQVRNGPLPPPDSISGSTAMGKHGFRRPIDLSSKTGEPNSSPILLSSPSSSLKPSHYVPIDDGSDMSSQISPSPSPSSSPVPPSKQIAVEPVQVEEPLLCPEQARLVKLIASGKNVFYTGSAGCGKSTVLKAFTKRLRQMGKNVRIVAPTGRAALQVNGSTTWTYAGWTPDHHKRTLDELRAGAHGKFAWKRFKETDVLVIDEISMVENLHFERLNEVMKAARQKSNFPGAQAAFGGVQVVVTGDFCQLPPVKPFQHCIECGFSLDEKMTVNGKVHVCKRHGEYRDEDKWAFRSKAWAECNFVHVHLNTIHRQNDETFIRILQKCRIGQRLSPEDTDLLMDHKCMVHHATRLFATREEVYNVNKREFEKLKTINHVYWCFDYFVWQQSIHPHLSWKGMRKSNGVQPEGPLRALDDHRFDECVQLKKGMLVVLLVNLDLETGLCNGSQGIICGFEKNDPKKLPQAKGMRNDPENRIFGDHAVLKEDQIKKFIESPGARYKTWPVVRFHNGQVRTIYANCSVTELGDERPYSLLMRTQIPLAPAWAMTIHKSQSLTLDRVIVNLSKAFEEGQVYVALSRATGLHGLKIEGDANGLLAGLGGNPEVQEFLREKFGDLNGALSS